MMLWGIRFLHTSSSLRCSAVTVEKSLLSKLRKSTGYSISHCKKALQMHENDIDEAKTWLDKQAQSEGWAKATKLSGRATKQGLVGISINENRTQGALFELNCETDFVARNQMFKELLGELTETCLQSGSALKLSDCSGTTLRKELLEKEQASALEFGEGKTLSDRVALAIGRLGENMAIARAIRVSTEDSDVELHAVTHPLTTLESNSVILGKFGSLVAVRKMSKEPVDSHVLKHLCLQVIGMNPESVGVPKSETAAETSDSSSSESDSSSSSSSSSDEEAVDSSFEKLPEDRFLLQQKWLENESYSVSQVVEDAGIEVVDFVRVEVGETASED